MYIKLSNKNHNTRSKIAEYSFNVSKKGI